MAHIDVKCTIWTRYHLPDDTDTDKIIEQLEEGKTVEDAILNVVPGEFGENGLEYQTLDETEEYMPPEKNDYHSTIEVYEDHSTLLWDNETKSEIEVE
jgi:hypothetical protein